MSDINQQASAGRLDAGIQAEMMNGQGMLLKQAMSHVGRLP